MNSLCSYKTSMRKKIPPSAVGIKGGGAVTGGNVSFTASGVNWYAALLNWTTPSAINIDIYQCTDNTYGSSVSPIASNVSNDYGSTTLGSYLLTYLNASTTYYYAITATESKTVLQTLTFQTSTQPTFGGAGVSQTSLFTQVNNGSNVSFTPAFAGCAVNGLNTKMLISVKTPNNNLYYSTSANNGSTWSTPIIIVGSGLNEIAGLSISYKGDIGIMFTFSTGSIFIINWRGSTPTYTLYQDYGPCTMVSINMQGDFAMFSGSSQNSVYYSKLNKSTNTFPTFTSVSVSGGFSYSGTFNASSTLFIGQSSNNRINVLDVNTTTSSVTFNKYYDSSGGGNSRGLLLLPSNMYVFRWYNGGFIKEYTAFNESSLPGGSTLTYTSCLSNITTVNSDMLSLRTSSSGFGNTLYYNGSNAIYKITL